jgi:hypothetical protein
MQMSLKSANRLTLRSALSWIRSTFPISHATRIAVEIYPELWESSRRKLNRKSTVDAGFREYVEIRSAQLAQLRVDELVRSQSRLSGSAATKLILSASRLATKMILAKAKASEN